MGPQVVTRRVETDEDLLAILALQRSQLASALSPEYDVVVTEIATRNGRSMRAHARVGFETIHTYRDATEEWAVVAMDLRS